MKMEVLAVQQQYQTRFGVLGSNKVKDWTSTLTPTAQLSSHGIATTASAGSNGTNANHNNHNNNNGNGASAHNNNTSSINNNNNSSSSSSNTTLPYLQKNTTNKIKNSIINKKTKRTASSSSAVPAVDLSSTAAVVAAAAAMAKTTRSSASSIGGSFYYQQSEHHANAYAHAHLYQRQQQAALNNNNNNNTTNNNNNNTTNKKNLFNCDDIDAAAVDELSLRLLDELRAAKSRHLTCTEVSLPCDLTPSIAAEIIRVSEKEPCGIRGCTIYIEFEDEPNNSRRIASLQLDPETVSTFEVYLTLRQDHRGWTALLPQFMKSLARTITISPEFTITKHKLYSPQQRSYSFGSGSPSARVPITGGGLGGGSSAAISMPSATASTST